MKAGELQTGIRLHFLSTNRWPIPDIFQKAGRLRARVEPGNCYTSKPTGRKQGWVGPWGALGLTETLSACRKRKPSLSGCPLPAAPALRPPWLSEPTQLPKPSHHRASPLLPAVSYPPTPFPLGGQLGLCGRLPSSRVSSPSPFSPTSPKAQHLQPQAEPALLELSQGRPCDCRAEHEPSSLDNRNHWN